MAKLGKGGTMPHKTVKGIDLMKCVSDKQAQDLRQAIEDAQKRLKKLHKRPAM